MVLTRRLKADNDRSPDCRELLSETIVVHLRRHHCLPPPKTTLGSFDRHLLTMLGQIDRPQHRAGRGKRILVMAGPFPKCCLGSSILEIRWPITTDLMKPAGAPRSWPHQGKSLTNRPLPNVLRPEFISKAVDRWAYENGVALDFSRPDNPTDNAFVESFTGRLRDECLNAHWFPSPADPPGPRSRPGGGAAPK